MLACLIEIILRLCSGFVVLVFLIERSKCPQIIFGFISKGSQTRHILCLVFIQHFPLNSTVLEHGGLLQNLEFHTPQYLRYARFHLLLACAFTLCDSEAQKDKKVI